MSDQTEKKYRSLPLFWQITLWVAVVLFLLLGLTMGLTLNDALSSFQAAVDDILYSTVATLTESPTVLASVRNGVCTPELMAYLDSVEKHTTSLDYITIAGADSVVIYHVEHQYIGWVFEGDDQARALAGESYLSDAESAMGPVHRAFGPVRDENGQVVGFVMAGTTRNLLQQLRQDVYITHLKLFAILMACSLALTGCLVLFLKPRLRSVRSEDLLRIFLTQNDILNNLDEGLVSLDERGRIRLVNQAAVKVLGSREERLLGRHIDDVLRGDRGQSLCDLAGQSFQTNRANILARSIQLQGSSSWSKQVLILIDKSEALRQAEQLNGSRHIISALRANTHEFLNKLQVISGLLQMGYIRDAQDYIGDISTTHNRSIGPVMQLIDNANVAALILGKMGNMRELNIGLTLLANSRLPERSHYLSTGELVTVVGNLLENAMEAVDAAAGDSARTIVLQITEDEKSLYIMVSDSGIGIAPKDLPRIYTPGFSTKAAQGRGVGMALIKEIADRRGGSIDVDTDPGSGTTVVLFFDKKREDWT